MPSVAHVQVKAARPKKQSVAAIPEEPVKSRRQPPVKAAPALKSKRNRKPLGTTSKLGHLIAYHRSTGVQEFVTRLAAATPMEMVSAEREGVNSLFLKDLAKHIKMTTMRVFDIVGVPKATAEKKVATQALISGSGGQAALGLARLLAMANGIVANSTAPEAEGFDAGKWLGEWIERPQPALGGQKPADLIGTPTGLAMVERVLGAIESGAYL